MIPSEPTEEMITAAEMKMPQLGRLQIRFLYETMVAAAPAGDEGVREATAQELRDAFNHWAFFSKELPEAIGYMQPGEAARHAFKAGAKWQQERAVLTNSDNQSGTGTAK